MTLTPSRFHEEPAFFVVDKPAGIGMHDDVDGPGLLTQSRELLNDDDLFLCHRLDRDTSGLLLIAKGKEHNARLSALFAGREIHKYYLALSAKKPGKKQGMIVGDMQVARNGNWKLLKSRKNPAVSQFFSYGLGGMRAFVVKPSTGKTHQIRVMLKSLSSPIIGDRRYAGEAHALSGFTPDRMYLHAYQLNFALQGRPYKFTCRPEEGELFLSSAFSQFLADLGDPELLSWPDIKFKHD